MIYLDNVLQGVSVQCDITVWCVTGAQTQKCVIVLADDNVFMSAPIKFIKKLTERKIGICI